MRSPESLPVIGRFHPILSVLLRLLLGVIFLSSGSQKLMHLDQFYLTAQNYHILTPEITQAYAAWLPWLEIFSGLCLLLGLFTRWAAMLAGLLLVSFLIATGWVLLRGDTVACGCFLGGPKETPITWDLWIRDVLLLLCAAYLFWSKQFPWNLESLLEKRGGLKTGLIAVLVLYLTITGMTAIMSPVPKPPPPPPVAMELLSPGTAAPDFTLPDLSGKPVSLKTYRGQPVLVEIFASWCPHCQHSVKELKQLEKDHPELHILSVNAGDQAGQPSTSLTFKKTFDIDYPILEHPDEAFIKNYRVSGFPTLYLVDPAGRIVWNHVGVVEPKHLTELEGKLGP